MTYYLLHMSDGTAVTVPELPDLESSDPVAADDLRSVEAGGSIDAKTMQIIPRHIVSFEIK